MNTFNCVATFVALFTSGCVSSDRYAPHESWPTRITAKSPKQFEGVYRNSSLSPDTGKPGTNTTQLFVFILGPTHSYGHQGERVELRFTEDESQLNIRLKDAQNQEIEAATLQRGVGFAFSNGRLIVRGPYSGLRCVDNNFGPEFTFERDELHLSTEAGFLGSSSRNGGMLCMAIIPTVVTKKYWWFWQKIAD